jgi:hypothetical protein
MVRARMRLFSSRLEDFTREGRLARNNAGDLLEF